MFSAEHVDSLFASTRAGIARSCQLLEERRQPSAMAAAATTGKRSGVLRPPPSLGLSTTPFAPTLRTLEGLSHLGAYTDVSRSMVARLESEAAEASPAVAKQRAKGRRFPLMQRMVKAATVAAAQGAWMDAEARQLWTDNESQAVDDHDGQTGHATSEAASDSVGGAALSSALVRCAFCVDAVHLLSEASEQCAMDAPDGGELVGLLHDFAPSVPSPLLSSTIQAMLLPLQCVPREQTTPSLLPLALLRFPSLVAYVLLEGAPSVAADAILRPVETESGTLLSSYLQNEQAFEQRARACALFFSAVAKALLGSLTQKGSPSLLGAGDANSRVLSRVKQLVTTFVTPVEMSFVDSVARPGMTAALHAALVAPVTAHLDEALASTAAASRCAEAVLDGARALLHTGVYRLLMVLESLGANEMFVKSGKANTVAQQKQYQQRLRQSNGKLTTPLFTSLVEDRQLLLEETNARSESGHRVLKITDGVHKTPFVFAYVDAGSVFVKHGRVGSFRAVASVEEVFSVFGASH